MNNIDKVKALMMAGWNGMIAGGMLTYDELADSLQDQVLDAYDMSADELDAEIANLLGWDIDNMTMDQWNEWKSIVREIAREYLEQ